MLALILLTAFQFGHMARVIDRYESRLSELIASRKEEIAEQKEHWREKACQIRKDNPVFFTELDEALLFGTLSPIPSGTGSTYLLTSQGNEPLFVIKPCDEAALCLHNPKNFASPFYDSVYRVRTHIPLYRTAQTDALAYQVACELGVGSFTPEAHLAILSHPVFYGEEKEKLCSVQRFLPCQYNLVELIQSLLDRGVPQTSWVSQLADRSEKMMLYIWCIGDTDAHVDNFPILNEMEVVKIDNSLSFPDVNSHLFDALFYLPHARNLLSEEGKKYIQTIPKERIVEKMHFFEMQSAASAFLERVSLLQALAERDGLTLAEIELRLRALELPNGKQVAQSNISFTKLYDRIFPENFESSERTSRSVTSSK